MLETLPTTNWSQISEEIPLSFIIMSHRVWDGGEGGSKEKGGGSQTSITGGECMDHGVPAVFNCHSKVGLKARHDPDYGLVDEGKGVHLWRWLQLHRCRFNSICRGVC